MVEDLERSGNMNLIRPDENAEETTEKEEVESDRKIKVTRPFRISDIIMSNKELYELLGNFGKSEDFTKDPQMNL